MFKQETSGSESRVLIASADAEVRRHIGDIVKKAELRAVGFIREAEQVESRTRLSMPTVLLLDMEMFRNSQSQGTRLGELRKLGAMKILLWGRHLSSQVVSQCKRDGIDAVLDLAGSADEDVDDHVRRLRQALGSDEHVVTPSSTPALPTVAACVRRKTLVPVGVVIGSSTGGPMALMTLLKGLPADFPLPIAVVQHMPPGFTRMLAERLHAECALRVVEGEAGMTFAAGTVYIAPGGVHMMICGSAKTPRIDLNTSPPENSCRPAVDVLFRSSAVVYGGRQHAIVLTGMGRDGLEGATKLHGLGSRIVVQDAATSTVWGMPGAIAQAGLADDILPIDQIAPQLMRCL